MVFSKNIVRTLLSTGSLVFPLLIFNTVATAELHSVDYGVIGACSLGKIAVMVLTWLLAYAVFQPRRRGRRQVFGFFQVAVLSRSCSEGCLTSEHRDLWCFVGPVGNGFWQPQSLPSLLWPPMTLRLVSQWLMPCTKRTCRFTSQEMLFGKSNCNH